MEGGKSLNPTFDYAMVFSDLNVGILYLLAISSLGVYGILTTGRSSDSKVTGVLAITFLQPVISEEFMSSIVESHTLLIC